MKDEILRWIQDLILLYELMTLTERNCESKTVGDVYDERTRVAESVHRRLQ
jgi:hypothetical protein